jgi:hypothetical protein
VGLESHQLPEGGSWKERNFRAEVGPNRKLTDAYPHGPLGLVGSTHSFQLWVFLSLWLQGLLLQRWPARSWTTPSLARQAWSRHVGHQDRDSTTSSGFTPVLC